MQPQDAQRLVDLKLLSLRQKLSDSEIRHQLFIALDIVSRLHVHGGDRIIFRMKMPDTF